MNITVNGTVETTMAKTVAEFLLSKGFERESFKGLIVEHNSVIVKTDKWDSILLNEDDNIEIIKLTGGG